MWGLRIMQATPIKGKPSEYENPRPSFGDDRGVVFYWDFIACTEIASPRALVGFIQRGENFRGFGGGLDFK